MPRSRRVRRWWRGCLGTPGRLNRRCGSGRRSLRTVSSQGRLGWLEDWSAGARRPESRQELEFGRAMPAWPAASFLSGRLDLPILRAAPRYDIFGTAAAKRLAHAPSPLPPFACVHASVPQSGLGAFSVDWPWSWGRTDGQLCCATLRWQEESCMSHSADSPEAILAQDGVVLARPSVAVSEQGSRPVPSRKIGSVSHRGPTKRSWRSVLVA